MDKVRTRITMRRQVADRLTATALFLENLNRDELADMILGGWLEAHVTVAVDGETFKLGEKRGLEIDGDKVRIVDVDFEGGETP